MPGPVRLRRIALCAGLFVMAFVAVAFTIRTVPDRVVGMLGGPSTQIDRLGGLRLYYQPAPGAEPAFERYLAQRGGAVKRDGDLLVIEMPGISADVIAEVTDVLVGGGLEFREALDSDYADQIGATDEVEVEVDEWSVDDGTIHATKYLRAYDPTAFERALAGARARGYELPPGTMLGFESVEPSPDAQETRPYWRSYHLASEVSIDGSMIVSATRVSDPNTGRPLVLLDFTREGGVRFAELTERIHGHKLAMVLGGRIRSAPIINGTIRGGRASITMGGGDPIHQEREAAALVAVLAQGGLPPGGTIIRHEVVARADVALQEWLGRLSIGLLAGLAFAGLTFLVLRFARPQAYVRPAPVEGRFPVRRLLVTLLAPVALIGGAMLTLPGLDELEFAHIARRELGSQESVIALGLMPIMIAFFLVELVALAVPRLRWRRHDPLGRVRLGQAVAVLGIAFALVQGYFVATYLESVGQGYLGSGFGAGPSVVLYGGLKLEVLVMGSLVGGTLLLVIVAGLIREHGLGNGYVALMASGFVIGVGRSYEAWLGLPRAAALGLIGAAAIAFATRCVLRWRIVAGDREPVLRLPTSGATPLTDTAALLQVVLLVISLGLGGALYETWLRVTEWTSNVKVMLLLLCVSVPVWAWVLARPALVARVALQGGLDRASPAAWRRATAVSFLLIAAVAALGAFAMHTSGTAYAIMIPFEVMIATAAVLDVVDDARAHRRKLVPAGVLHQVQYVGVIAHVLAEAGIPAHFHASNVRALFAFFGPWAPVIIYVPEQHGEAARTAVDDVIRSSRSSVPRVQVVASQRDVT